LNRIKADAVSVRTASGALYEFRNVIADKFGDLVSISELGSNDKTYFIVHQIESISFKEVAYEQN